MPPPPAEPPPYSPPPTSAPTYAPPVFAQQFGAPYAPYTPPPQAAPRRAGGRTLLVSAIIAVVVLAALGGGAALANASLSSTYSPQRAASDYFSAMGKGDVNGMMSNGTLLTGDSAYSDFFSKSALSAMLAVDQNKQISNVRVGASSRIDDSTSSVDVSLSWGGVPHSMTYKAVKDPSRVHDLLYDSWRLQIPFTTIAISLPNQPGAVQLDGLLLPGGSAGKAEAIQGFHKITMSGTFLYDEKTQVADGTTSSATAAFPTALSSKAQQAAVTAVKASFGNVTCDAANSWDCPNHQYTVPSGFVDDLPAAGGTITANSSWKIVFTGDPTLGMKLAVTTTDGEVDASGVCAMTLTVDGGRTYHFTGTWTGVLTVASFSFGSHVLEDCDSARA